MIRVNRLGLTKDQKVSALGLGNINNFIKDDLGDSIENGKANGYYFKRDGTFLGKEGSSLEIVICDDKKEIIQIKNNKNIKSKYYINPKRDKFQLKDIETIGGVIYAESSIEHKEKFTENEMMEEAYAFACTMINFKFKRRHDDLKFYNPSYAQLSLDMRAYGYNSRNYNVFSNTEIEKRNNNGMKIYIGAAIYALLYEKQYLLKDFNITTNQIYGFNNNNNKTNDLLADYSNNAILWDGIDLKTNYDNHPKIKQGYFISDDLHNVLNIVSKKTTESKASNGKVCNDLYSVHDPKFKETKCYEYTYKTTNGIAKTMFVKLTDDFEKSNINSIRKIKEDKYILNQWW